VGWSSPKAGLQRATRLYRLTLAFNSPCDSFERFILHSEVRVQSLFISGLRVTGRVCPNSGQTLALENGPELNDLFQRMLTDFLLSDEFNRRLNERMVDRLQDFWDLVAIAAVQGALGDRGKVWGHDFKMIGRQITGD
jgi:hypothetical protein